MGLRATLSAAAIFLCLASQAFASVSGQGLLTGKMLNVKPGNKGTVVVFLSAKCPCSDSHVPVLKKLAEEFKDFSFVAIHSNADEQIDSSKSYFETAKLPFPVLQDEKSKIADEYRAFKTPHVFVLSPEGKIL